MMTKEELFELVDIETGEDFTYFENFANLMEADEYITEEDIGMLIKELDCVTFSELAESYFYDVMEHLPDNAIDIYSTMEAVKRNIVSISTAIAKGEEQSHKLCRELYNFRNWYIDPQSCFATDLTSGNEDVMSIRDAIYENKLARITKTDWNFDFSECNQLEISEYIINIGELS